MKVPFNRPYIDNLEMKYIEDAILHNKISGDGFYSKKINQFIEQKFGIMKALFVNSGTAALDMSALLLDLKKDDEVIMPSYTFVSTANAVKLRGAKIRFIDIEPQTMNMDPDLLPDMINPRTKAIYAVHYAGISCDMGNLMKIARNHNLNVVEDAAQAVNAKYKDKYLGSIGEIGAYSFHETKNYVCGEGGALLLNSPELLKRAEIIWEKGTNRRQFFRGEVDKYSWVDIGSSYLGSDILAAFLTAQFEKLDQIQQLRKQAYIYYSSSLRYLEDKNLARLPGIPSYSTPNYHIFYLILNSGKERDHLMQYLKKQGIQAIFHYIPLHSSPMGRKLGNIPEDLPITEEYAKRLIRLPLYAGLTKKEQDYIITHIHKYFTKV